MELLIEEKDGGEITTLWLFNGLSWKNPHIFNR